MKYHCEQQEKFSGKVFRNCPTWDQCHHRGICLATPKATPKATIYIASKAIHGPRWQELRAGGVPIISTWIDESRKGETVDWADLWVRCVREAAMADVTVLYCEEGEHLKGALVEVGAALASGKLVYAVGVHGMSFLNHPHVITCPTLESALALL